MSQIDYTVMTDLQLKRYLLENRQDRDALKAYLQRRRTRSSQAIAAINDPDFDTKIQAAIRQQIDEYKK